MAQTTLTAISLFQLNTQTQFIQSLCPPLANTLISWSKVNFSAINACKCIAHSWSEKMLRWNDKEQSFSVHTHLFTSTEVFPRYWLQNYLHLLKKFPVFVFIALLPSPNQGLRLGQPSHDFSQFLDYYHRIFSPMMYNTKNIEK